MSAVHLAMYYMIRNKRENSKFSSAEGVLIATDLPCSRHLNPISGYAAVPAHMLEVEKGFNSKLGFQVVASQSARGGYGVCFKERVVLFNYSYNRRRLLLQFLQQGVTLQSFYHQNPQLP